MPSNSSPSAPKHNLLYPLLRPLPIKSKSTLPIPSLIKDRHSQEDSILPATMNPFDALTYLRPSNQLILLLQKGVDFPDYPPELEACIDDDTWYRRMDELEMTLARYWSWVEKALFAFAFAASVLIPWPIISAISTALGADDSVYYVEDLDDYSSLSTTDAAVPTAVASTATAVTSAAARLTSSLTGLSSDPVTSAARTVSSTAARLVRKQLSTANETGSDFYDSYLDDSSDWAGSEYWVDYYGNHARWAAIGIVIAIVIAVWLPWIILTTKNNRRLRDLILSWNIEDEKHGSMNSLTWSLDKAPAFSNAKFLIIGLPPCLHQRASTFHENAYPPVYGYAGGTHANSLPDYHEEGRDFEGDDKESWYAPPQALDQQKVHVGKEENVARDPEDPLHRVNSAAPSLPSSRRHSLISKQNQDGGFSDVASDHTSTVEGEPLEPGLTRPRRSSTRSSKGSGRIL